MMGFMRIAPQKTRRLTATTVCLEYGKPDPHPRVAYRMIPLETFSKDARVIQLCQSLGQGTIDQPTAQAVAWHLANGLSWEKLAGLNRMESRYLGNIKYFKRAELARAQKWFEGLRGEDESTTLSDYPPIAARD